MRKLTATLCLTLTILLGSVGMSASADFQNGLTALKSGDYATALREFRPLAEQGNTSAQHKMGWMYDTGKGVPQDYKTAVKWYRLAAEQGYAGSQNNLGSMYANGQGVPQDYKTAVKWFKLAAKQGSALAQNSLGKMYRYGEGVSQDYKTAVKWYRLAAEQGDADAQGNLGAMYATGQGGIKDFKTAFKWWKLAAEQGDAGAQYYLGVMYARGEGVVQNEVYAHMWANIAATNGYGDGAKVRDLVAEGMTSEQIAEAQKLAHECIRKKYKECKENVFLNRQEKNQPHKTFISQSKLEMIPIINILSGDKSISNIKLLLLRCISLYTINAGWLLSMDKPELRKKSEYFSKSTEMFLNDLRVIEKDNYPNSPPNEKFFISQIEIMTEKYTEIIQKAKALTGNFYGDPVVLSDMKTCKDYSSNRK